MRTNITLLFTIVLCLFATNSWGQWSTNPTVNNSVNTFSGIQLKPHGIDDGDNGAIIAWVDDRSGTNTDIYAQRIDKDGFLLWEITGEEICINSSNQNWVQPVQDGNGGSVIAWVDYRNADADIYAQRVDADGNTMWASDGIAICNASGIQENIAIALDSAGDIVLCWEDVRSGDRDLYAQKIDINGNPQWAANGIPVSTVTGSQHNPHMFADASGGVFISWADDRAAGDAFAQRLDASGTSLWTANGLQISNVGNVQLTGIAPSANGAIIYWLEGSLLWTQATAQRIDANGANVWAAGGVSITTGSTVWLVMMDMVQDGDNGAYFVWTDTRNGGLDGYVQRIRANGGAVAPVGGDPLTGLATGESYPNISMPTCSGDENIIITWEDGRNASQDIFSQKYDTTLSKLWAPNGVAVSTNPATQSLLPHSTITMDNGIVTVWRDFRNSADGDIYCQSIDCSGNLGGLLPVSFLEVTAMQSGDDAVLQWTTENEINSDFFEIEKSLGNGEFEMIGKVRSQSMGTGTYHYRFTDDNASDGINQYRIKQIDFDGSASYSKVATVMMGDEIELQAYPNPTTDYIYVNGIDASDSKKFSVEIYDEAGKLIREEKLNSTFRIDLSNLNDGNYILKLTDKKQTANLISHVIKLS